MADYVCKDPTCTESVAWHLINGELDCIGDNREAVAAFAIAAEANMPRPEVTLSLHITCTGYEDQSTTIILPALPSETTQLENAQDPPVEVIVQEGAPPRPPAVPDPGMPDMEM